MPGNVSTPRPSAAEHKVKYIQIPSLIMLMGSFLQASDCQQGTLSIPLSLVDWQLIGGGPQDRDLWSCLACCVEMLPDAQQTCGIPQPHGSVPGKRFHQSYLRNTGSIRSAGRPRGVWDRTQKLSDPILATGASNIYLSAKLCQVDHSQQVDWQFRQHSKHLQTRTGSWSICCSSTT